MYPNVVFLFSLEGVGVEDLDEVDSELEKLIKDELRSGCLQLHENCCEEKKHIHDFNINVTIQWLQRPVNFTNFCIGNGSVHPCAYRKISQSWRSSSQNLMAVWKVRCLVG